MDNSSECRVNIEVEVFDVIEMSLPNLVVLEVLIQLHISFFVFVVLHRKVTSLILGN